MPIRVGYVTTDQLMRLVDSIPFGGTEKTVPAFLDRVRRQCETKGATYKITLSQLRRLERLYHQRVPQSYFDIEPAEFFEMVADLPKTPDNNRLRWTIAWCKRDFRRFKHRWRPTTQQYDVVRTAWLDNLDET